MEGLQKVHKELHPPHDKTGIAVRETLSLVIRDSSVMLPEKESKFAYGLSKMTVMDDVKGRDEYNKLRFVEFLEFIGRVAHIKYFEEPGDVSLAEKIERILDQILPVFGLKR